MVDSKEIDASWVNAISPDFQQRAVAVTNSIVGFRQRGFARGGDELCLSGKIGRGFTEGLGFE